VKSIVRLRVLLISFGQLNGLLLKLLARLPEVQEVVVATREPTRAEPALNLARMAAGAEDLFPRLRAVACDFNQTETAAQTLRAIRPDVSFAAPSLQSWWVLEQIPAAAAAPLRDAGYGAWLPLQLAPMMRLMKAWKLSGVATPLISAPYPDVVNPILATQDLAPTCGVGNVDEIVPKLRWRAAESMAVDPGEVRVFLTAHHALETFVFRAAPPAEPAPPYLLRIEGGGKVLDSPDDAHRWILEPYPLARGLDFHFLTAGSAIRLIRALGAGPGVKTALHVPGPKGLPGGYPVIVEEGKVAVDLPAGWSLVQAIEVNRVSHRWDGIDSLDGDGSFQYTDRTATILHDKLGFDRKKIAPEEVDSAARELSDRFAEYVRRFQEGSP
jgi:hypothetical protein